MTTDLYAKCPCGSGKKIKFCCKDIISDIERIERMLRGEQRTAAIEKINKLLEKHPDRPALMSLKAQVHLELQNVEAATPIVDKLLQVEPDNPSALAMKATILSADGDLPAGLQLFHRALRLSENVLSQMVYRSYVSICIHLIQREEFIAAYAHLLTLVSITKGQDRASVSMLMNVTSSEKLPAIFQGLLISDQCPENVTWKREFEFAIELYRHGDWSAAAATLEDMSSRILDEPTLLRNQAIFQVWTCQTEEAIKSFRNFASIRNVDLHQAVEAEACAQVLSPPDESDLVKLVSITQDIEDADSMMETLLSVNTVDSIPVPRDPDSDTSPPKGQFVFFDPPFSDVQSDDELGLDQLPREYATATLYGKETDRSARLTVVVFKDDNFIANIQRLNQITGETLKVDADLPTVGQVHKIERLFRPNFRVPPKTIPEKYDEHQQQWIRTQLDEVWPNLKLKHFGDQTAKAAAGERKYQRAVLASILNLEIWSDRQPYEYDFDKLRADLGLPVTEPIDPNEVNLRSLSPSRLRALQLEKLSGQDLKFIFEVVSVRPNGKLLYKIGKEVLARDSMEDHFDMVEVHGRLAELAPNSDLTLEHLSKARDLAVAEGESPATWLISELDVRIRRGEVDVTTRLMSEIQTRYLGEPGVRKMLASVLEKYGLMPTSPGGVSASQMPPEPAPAEVGTPVASRDGIWTPDAGESASSPPGDAREEKSKLWVPGMD